MKKLKLVIDDFVNFKIQGLTSSEINKIQSKTSHPVKGAFTTAAFRSGIWDGRESLLTDDGIGVQADLDKTLDALEELGYDLDNDIVFVDKTPVIDIEVPPVDENFVLKESGFPYRDYQLDGVNSAVRSKRGILDIGTNGGKSWICVGISKAYDGKLKTVVIVPSENLVSQVHSDYKKTDLNVAALTSKVPPNKRKSVIDAANHVVITTKLFMNCVGMFSSAHWGIIVDECHKFGEVFRDMLRYEMGHCPVRIGMTGTVPNIKKDPFKRHMILSTLNGDVLRKVSQRELIDRGISSNFNISVVTTVHPEVSELSKDKDTWDWSVEESYLGSNQPRISAIADYIRSFETKNTLILCHRQLGLRLGEILGVPVIVDEVKPSQREEWFAEFDKRDDFILVATYDCVGTGISINRIFRQFMIDVGKNETYIIQGIGRAIRRDGVLNTAEVIDIHADTRYSLLHKKERRSIYRNEKFEFTDDGSIEVRDV